MIVGQETFDTAEFVGALGEAFVHKYLVNRVFRQKVRIHFCGTPNSTDSNVRRAVLDRFGGEKKAIGGVKCPKCKGKGWFGSGRKECPECLGAVWKHPPGKVMGLKDDEWQALALALYHSDTSLTGREKRGDEPMVINREVMDESMDLIGLLLNDAEPELKEAYLKAENGLAANISLKFNPKGSEIEIETGISFVTSKFTNRIARRVSDKQLNLIPPDPVAGARAGKGGKRK